jgi:LPXTG-site transpeptidase (sortase) family protein
MNKKDKKNKIRKKVILAKKKEVVIPQTEIVSEIPKPAKPNRLALLKTKRFKIFLIALLVLTIIVCVVVLILPIWPKLFLSLKNVDPNKVYYPISFPSDNPNSEATGELNVASTEEQKPIPAENRLVIPKIDVDSEIIEGGTLDVLLSNEGVWREPSTGNPLNGGNMVIAGHRFQYVPPNTHTFYNLEELTIGDKIIVFWHQTPYIYEIYKTLVVNPDEVGIRNAEYDKEITLYTCTPLYTSEKRFAVKARLI